VRAKEGVPQIPKAEPATARTDQEKDMQAGGHEHADPKLTTPRDESSQTRNEVCARPQHQYQTEQDEGGVRQSNVGNMFRVGPKPLMN
jgi:hypothetical protein